MIHPYVMPGLQPAVYKPPEVTTYDPMHVIDKVFAHFGTNKCLYLSKSRYIEIAWPRAIAIYLICEMSGQKVVTIAGIFGMHHSTIIYHRDTITNQLRVDKITAKVIDLIRQKIKNNAN